MKRSWNVRSFAAALLVAAGMVGTLREVHAQATALPEFKTPRSVHVTVINGTKLPVRICWIDPAGKIVPYRDLRAGEEYQQQTFVGHHWVAVFPDGRGPRIMVVNDGRWVVQHPTAAELKADPFREAPKGPDPRWSDPKGIGPGVGPGEAHHAMRPMTHRLPADLAKMPRLDVPIKKTPGGKLPPPSFGAGDPYDLYGFRELDYKWKTYENLIAKIEGRPLPYPDLPVAEQDYVVKGIQPWMGRAEKLYDPRTPPDEVNRIIAEINGMASKVLPLLEANNISDSIRLSVAKYRQGLLDRNAFHREMNHWWYVINDRSATRAP